MSTWRIFVRSHDCVDGETDPYSEYFDNLEEAEAFMEGLEECDRCGSYVKHEIEEWN